MAFIPDDAEDRFNELSPSAERFYIYLCRTRNHKMQVSFGSLDACADKYEWSRATKFGVQKELVDKGWIEKDGSAWLLLVGDFSPVNKSKKLDFSHEQESKKLDLESKNLDYQSKKLDSPIYKEVPEIIPAILPEKEKEKVQKKPQSVFVNFPIPRNDVQPDLWNAYLESRARMKIPLTENAYKKIVGDLLKIPLFDINSRLIDAVDRKWQGLIFKADLESRGVNQNGSTKENHPSVPGSGRPSNIEQVLNTDYSQFAGQSYPG